MRRVKMLLVLLFTLIFSCASHICSGDSLDSWTLRNKESSGSLGDTAYGNNMFVAVGHSPGGTIMYSPLGVTWTTAQSGSTSLLSGLAFGEGLFIATGSNGEILSSADGISWQRRGAGITTATLSCATHGNGRFVAAGC